MPEYEAVEVFVDYETVKGLLKFWWYLLNFYMEKIFKHKFNFRVNSLNSKELELFKIKYLMFDI